MVRRPRGESGRSTADGYRGGLVDGRRLRLHRLWRLRAEGPHELAAGRKRSAARYRLWPDDQRRFKSALRGYARPQRLESEPAVEL